MNDTQLKLQKAKDFVAANLKDLCNELEEKNNCCNEDWKPFEKIPLTMELSDLLEIFGQVRYSLGESLVKAAAVKRVAMYGNPMLLAERIQELEARLSKANM